MKRQLIKNLPQISERDTNHIIQITRQLSRLSTNSANYKKHKINTFTDVQ